MSIEGIVYVHGIKMMEGGELTWSLYPFFCGWLHNDQIA